MYVPYEITSGDPGFRLQIATNPKVVVRWIETADVASICDHLPSLTVNRMREQCKSEKLPLWFLAEICLVLSIIL